MLEAVVIGVSAGGGNALKTILPALPADFPLSIAIVQHLDPSSDSYMSAHLNRISAITVKEAEDKEHMGPATAYLAPPGYHLLIEPDKSFSLSVDERVNFSRPAIDLLFDSAAEAYGKGLIGVVLTGANTDGAKGLKTVKSHGGVVIVQNPETAEVSVMPQAALEAASPVDHIAHLEHIAPLLIHLCEGNTHATGTEG